MDVSLRLNRFFLLYAHLVFILFIISAIIELPTMWGVNHLYFIDTSVKYIFILPFIISLLCTLFIKETSFDDLFNRIFHNIIFENNISFTVSLLFLTAIFYIFKLNTFFLGDGYTWIATYSNPDYLIVKPTELLSGYIVKGVQLLFGEESEATSSMAFQFISLFSGVIFLVMMRNSIKLLIADTRLRTFGFLSFVTSGMVLLFMGYIEFYPMLWMATSVYLYYCIKSLESSKYLLFAIPLFFILLLVHAQSVYLSFGFLYLIAWRGINKHRLKRIINRYWPLIVVTTAIGSAGILFFAYSNYKITQILLPLFTSKPDNPGYTVFSAVHLLDIANLILLLFPVLVIAGLTFIMFIRKVELHETEIFLLLSSIGSILFLLFVEPYIGFARDWDLMSMTLLFPLLFSFYFFEKIEFKFSGKLIFILLALSLSITSSYIYINVKHDLAVDRYASIIESKEGLQYRPGWTILNNYYIEIDQVEKSNEIRQKMDERFPEYNEMNKAYSYISAKNYPTANTISSRLIDRYPNNIDFIQLRAKLLVEVNMLDSAQYYLDKALSIQSTYPPVLMIYGELFIAKGDLKSAIKKLEEAYLISNGKLEIIEPLAFCYIQTNQLLKAAELAATLHEQKTSMQTYHLISMMISLKSSNNKKAAQHYEKFLSFGNTRADFDEIKQSYSYLIPVSDN